MGQPAASQRFETAECSIEVARLRVGRVLVKLQGRDRGQLGREPFAAIESNFSPELPIELFIDLQSAVGATLDVSSSWAIWLRANKQHLAKVSMLTGSSFVQLSAQAVQRFSELGEKAQIYSDRDDFEHAYRARG